MAEVIRIIELQDMLLYFQEGFSGSSAVDDATLAASDTIMGVDTHALRDSRTTVPIGARFTTAGIATVRTVTATQNSQQWTLDLSASSAGTFDITVNGDTEAGVAFDVVDSVLEAALEALSAVGVGNVTVVEVADVYTITFAGTLANISTNTLTVDGSSLTAANSEVLTAIQTGLVTWEVTFTPAIATGSVPSDDDVITWYPRRLEFEPEGGEFEWGQTRERIIRKPRGIIKGSRRGVEQEMTVTTSFPFEFLRAQTTATDELDELTPYEVLEQEGFASDWMPSSHGGECEPYSIDLVIVDKPDCLSQQAQVWIFPQFDYTDLGPTVSEGIINLTGACVATKPITYRVDNNDDAINVIF